MKNFKKKNISVILLNHGEEMTREKFKRVIEQELGIEENKIHLFDKRNRFIFSKHGLEKKIPIKEEEKQNEKERKERKDRKIIKREYS